MEMKRTNAIAAISLTVITRAKQLQNPEQDDEDETIK